MTIRPALRPGAVLLRRDATHLQIGTSPGFVLRDRPGLFSVLHLLDGIRDVRRISDLTATHFTEFDGDVPAIINELMAAGLVFDARSWDFPGDPDSSAKHDLPASPDHRRLACINAPNSAFA